MKKLKKLNLHHLNQSEMTKKEMRTLKGGVNTECECYCMCRCDHNCTCNYAGPQEGPNDSYYGGSSTSDNRTANGGANVSDMTNPLTKSVHEHYKQYGGY